MSTLAKLYSVSRFIRITVCPSIEVGARLCLKTFTPPASACSAANIRSVSARTKLSTPTPIDTLRPPPSRSGESLLRRRRPEAWLRRWGTAPGHALGECPLERCARRAAELLDDVRHGLDLGGREPQEQPLVRVDPADEEPLAVLGDRERPEVPGRGVEEARLAGRGLGLEQHEVAALGRGRVADQNEPVALADEDDP